MRNDGNLARNKDPPNLDAKRRDENIWFETRILRILCWKHSEAVLNSARPGEYSAIQRSMLQIDYNADEIVPDSSLCLNMKHYEHLKEVPDTKLVMHREDISLKHIYEQPLWFLKAKYAIYPWNL